MREFWFVVHPGNDLLYEALKRVLEGRPGFRIIKDRRSFEDEAGEWTGSERRTAHVWASNDVLIAECEKPM
jgi:hypothetical protein